MQLRIFFYAGTEYGLTLLLLCFKCEIRSLFESVLNLFLNVLNYKNVASHLFQQFVKNNLIFDS